MEYCGFFSGRLGSDNQTRGLILEAEADKKVPVTRNKLLQAPNGQPLDRSRYPDEKSFKKDVYASLDAYLADAEAMLLDSGYVMPLYNETYTWLLRDTLTGLQTDGMGVYYFQNVVKAAS